MIEAALVFVAVYALNLVPAFAPPTWMALSLIGFNHPATSVPLLALIGASAATCGRLTLAKAARVIVRQRYFDDDRRRNVDAIKVALEGRRTLTVGAFLLYAFTPFPSNFLFIAYGLTSLPWPRVALPFFCGRFVSYSFWVFGASTAARRMALQPEDLGSYLGGWFLATQCFFLALLYAFAKLDWRHLLQKGRWRWLPRSGRDGAAKP